MKDMKDPIQGTLDAVREVEIRIGQIRLLWSEDVTLREAAMEQLQRVSRELDQAVARAQLSEAHNSRVEPKPAESEEPFRPGPPPAELRAVCEEWEQVWLPGDKDPPAPVEFVGERYRFLYQDRACSQRRSSMEGAILWPSGKEKFRPHKKTWAEVEALAAAAKHRREGVEEANAVTARLRADGEQAREYLGLASPVERDLAAAHATIWGLVCALTEAYADAKSARDGRNRLRRSNDCVREALGAEPGESPVGAAERVARSRKNLESMAEKERVVMDRLVRQERSARDLVARLLSDMTYQQQRFDRMQADLVAERDAALARVAELERAIDLEWSPYVHRAAESKS